MNCLVQLTGGQFIHLLFHSRSLSIKSNAELMSRRSLI